MHLITFQSAFPAYKVSLIFSRLEHKSPKPKRFPRNIQHKMKLQPRMSEEKSHDHRKKLWHKLNYLVAIFQLILQKIISCYGEQSTDQISEVTNHEFTLVKEDKPFGS